MLLSLLFKAMKGDVSTKRVAAFAKRLLQVAQEQQPAFTCGCLLMLSEILKVWFYGYHYCHCYHIYCYSYFYSLFPQILLPPLAQPAFTCGCLLILSEILKVWFCGVTAIIVIVLNIVYCFCLYDFHLHLHLQQIEVWTVTHRHGTALSTFQGCTILHVYTGFQLSMSCMQGKLSLWNLIYV